LSVKLNIGVRPSTQLVRKFDAIKAGLLQPLVIIGILPSVRINELSLAIAVAYYQATPNVINLSCFYRDRNRKKLSYGMFDPDPDSDPDSDPEKRFEKHQTI
jgi:hypothetical protein